MSGSLPSSRHRRKNGFTIIELLIALAIIGILAAVLGATLLGVVRDNQVRDAAVTLTTDLRLARTQAQRTSQNSTVTLIGTPPTARYTTQWGGGSAVSKSLPQNMEITPLSGSASSIVYSSPYGELPNSTGVVWKVGLSGTSRAMYIKTIGVTGKVVLSATP